MRARLSVVIVDENGADLPVFKRLVTEFVGSHVMCFPTQEAAERECATNAPDIFIIDDPDTHDVPMSFDPHFRERPGLRDALIVLLSSRDGPLPDQARSSGVDVFLPKPVDTKFFMAMLHQALKLRAARAAIA